MNLGVKGDTRWQQINGVKVVARFENARDTALQTYLHLPTQYEHPLRRGGAMKLTPETHRALAQLQTARGHQARQHGLRVALIHFNRFLAKLSPPIGVSEKNDFGESCHDLTDRRIGLVLIFSEIAGRAISEIASSLSSDLRSYGFVKRNQNLQGLRFITRQFERLYG